MLLPCVETPSNSRILNSSSSFFPFYIVLHPSWSILSGRFYKPRAISKGLGFRV